MHAMQRAQNAYAVATTSSAATTSGRELEYKVFAHVTRALGDARDSGDIRDIAAATYDNTRLWIALAADVAQEGNALPPLVRSTIVDLAGFAQAHAGRVLRGTATVDALIDVNTTIMKGLRGAPADDA